MSFRKNRIVIQWSTAAAGWLFAAVTSWAAPASPLVLSFNVSGALSKSGRITIQTDSSGNLKSMLIQQPGESASQVSLAQLQKGHVLARLQEDGFFSGVSPTALKLSAAPGINPSTGGVLTLEYLKHFPKMERGTFRLRLLKKGDSWILQDSQGKPFRALQITAWQQGRTGGISSIAAVPAGSAKKISRVENRFQPAIAAATPQTQVAVTSESSKSFSESKLPVAETGSGSSSNPITAASWVSSSTAR